MAAQQAVLRIELDDTTGNPQGNNVSKQKGEQDELRGILVNLVAPFQEMVGMIAPAASAASSIIMDAGAKISNVIHKIVSWSATTSNTTSEVSAFTAQLTVAATLTAVALIAVASAAKLLSMALEHASVLVGRYSQVDPGVAAAKAEADAVQLLGDVRRAMVIGQELVDFTRVQSRLSQAWQDLVARFEKYLIRYLTKFLELAEAVLKYFDLINADDELTGDAALLLFEKIFGGGMPFPPELQGRINAARVAERNRSRNPNPNRGWLLGSFAGGTFGGFVGGAADFIRRGGF